MRTIDKIFEELKEIADGQRWEEVEPFLTGCLDEAREEENYGIYIGTGNELLRFYRETEQFKKALDLSEDLLLLMEELQLDETEHFATVMLNVAAACPPLLCPCAENTGEQAGNGGGKGGYLYADGSAVYESG